MFRRGFGGSKYPKAEETYGHVESIQDSDDDHDDDDDDNDDTIESSPPTMNRKNCDCNANTKIGLGHGSPEKSKS